MSVQEFITVLSGQKILVSAFLLMVPLMCVLFRLIHGKVRGSLAPWKYIYSVVIYFTCIPGMFSLALISYNLLFLQQNLLELDIYVYYLPIISMVATLSIMRESIDFNRLPGFTRLSGLMLIIGIAFFITLILDKLRVYVVFGGSIFSLFIIGLIIFFVLKYAIRLIFGAPKKKNSFDKYRRI